MDRFGRQLSQNRCAEMGTADKIYSWVAKFLIKLASLFCEVDFYGGRRGGGRGGVCKFRGAKLIVKLIDLVYLYTITRMSLSLWFSYVHDRHVNNYKLYKLQENKEPGKMLAYIEALELARMNAKRIGAPYLEFTYLTETGYLVLIWLSLAGKLGLCLYFRFWEPFEAHLIRSLLDAEWEQANTGRLVRAEVERFQVSSRTFAQIHLETDVARLAQFFGHLPSHCRPPTLVADQLNTSLGQLELMVATGNIQPLSRRPGRVQELARLYCLFCLSFLCFALVFCVFLMIGLVNLPQFKRYKMGSQPMDLVLIADTSLLIAITFGCIAFYYSVLFINSMDQILMLNQINRMLRACIQLNWSRCETLEGAEQVDTMNERLLHVLIHYRLVVRQANLSQPMQGLLVLVSTFCSTMIPLIVRLHAPHLDAELLPVAVWAAGALLMWNIFGWAPICLLHSRSHGLYEGLFALAAHGAEVRLRRPHCYHQHSLWLLAKELQQPEHLVDQFTTRRLSLPFTYPNFLRYLFWLGLLLLSTGYLHQHRGPDVLAFL